MKKLFAATAVSITLAVPALADQQEFKPIGVVAVPVYDGGQTKEAKVNTYKKEPSQTIDRPMVKRDGWQETSSQESASLAADRIEGSSVYGSKEESVREIDRLVMGSGGKIKQFVINVGGILGLGEKPVAVVYDRLQLLRKDDEVRVYIDLTAEKLEQLPEFEATY
ncbi:MAG: hypothetical protein AAFQ42_01985 [Pseudomonadota bacterium]